MRPALRAALLAALLLAPIGLVQAGTPEAKPWSPYTANVEATSLALAAEGPTVAAPLRPATGTTAPINPGQPAIPGTGAATETFADMAILHVESGLARLEATPAASATDLDKISYGRAAVAVSRDGTAIASVGPAPTGAGGATQPTLFYARSGEANFTAVPTWRNFTLEGTLVGLAISDDGRRVALATQIDRNISLRGFALANNALSEAFDLRAPGFGYALATDGALGRIYLGGQFAEGNATYGGVFLYPFAQALPLASWYDRSANGTNLTALSASRDSAMLAAAAGTRVLLFAGARDGLEEPAALNLSEAPSRFAMAEDGARLAVVANKTLLMLNATGAPAIAWNVTVPGAAVASLATNATGALTLVASSGSGGGVHAYGENGGEPVFRFTGDARGADISADGSTIAYAMRSVVHVARLPRVLAMDLVGGGKVAPMRSLTVPGSITYEVNVRNDGAAPETVVFAGGAPPEVSLSAQPASLQLRPGESQKVTLLVNSTAALVGPRVFNVSARATTSGAVDNVTLSVEPQPTLDVKFLGNETEFVARPNETMTVTLAIVNNGTSDAAVGVRATQQTSAGPAWSLSLPESSFNAVRGTRQTVRVLVTPPADAANGTSSTVTLTLEGQDIFDQVELHFRINPNLGVKVNATGVTKFVEPSKRASFNVTVTNTGSLPREFEVYYEFVQSPDAVQRAWSVDMQQQTFRIEANAKKVVAVSVLAPSDVQPNDKVTIRVVARSIAGAPNETRVTDNVTLYGIAVAPVATSPTPTGNGIPFVAPLAAMLTLLVAARLLRRRPQ